MNNSVTTLIIMGAVMFAVIGILTVVSNIYSLNNIKNKRVGHGQHGNARFATEKEVKKIYRLVPYEPKNGEIGKVTASFRREQWSVCESTAASCVRLSIPAMFIQ